MKALHVIAFILVVVGGLNWGLMGLGYFGGSNWNVVGLLLGDLPDVEAIVYVLVGVSALWLLLTHSKECSTCK
jgi:uncharacterized protein